MLVQSFSGIRGIYGKDLTKDIARRYAFVFNEFLKSKISKEPLVVVGYDTRASAHPLKEAMFDSLCNIIDVGVMPVAAVELGVRDYGADGGIMITASHNEPEYNGFKFLDKDGAVLRPKDIKKLIEEFKKINELSEELFLEHLGKGKLKIKKVEKRNKDLIKRYAHFLVRIIGKIDNKAKIILDVNGGSAVILKEILNLTKIGNIKVINDRPGDFRRKIEPNEDSLMYLKDIIKKEKAEFAAGFDCDADRAEILLADGKMVDGNYLLALIVDDVLERNKGIVVVNDATSNVVRRVAERHGCEVREVEVGEINVVDEMLGIKSPVGGEGSNGGVIIPPSRCRDGIMSVLYLLKIIKERGKSLKDLMMDLPKYSTIQKKVILAKPLEREKIKKYYLQKKCLIQETGDSTGGLKVLVNKNNFVWFRISKTEPNLLRIIADSVSELEAKRLLAEAFSLL